MFNNCVGVVWYKSLNCIHALESLMGAIDEGNKINLSKLRHKNPNTFRFWLRLIGNITATIARIWINLMVNGARWLAIPSSKNSRNMFHIPINGFYYATMMMKSQCRRFHVNYQHNGSEICMSNFIENVIRLDNNVHLPWIGSRVSCRKSSSLHFMFYACEYHQA